MISKQYKKFIIVAVLITVILLLLFSLLTSQNKAINVSSNTGLSKRKSGWGTKRNMLEPLDIVNGILN